MQVAMRILCVFFVYSKWNCHYTQSVAQQMRFKSNALGWLHVLHIYNEKTYTPLFSGLCFVAASAAVTVGAEQSCCCCCWCSFHTNTKIAHYNTLCFKYKRLQPCSSTYVVISFPQLTVQTQSVGFTIKKKRIIEYFFFYNTVISFCDVTFLEKRFVCV